MEALCSSESSGTALDLVLMSVIESAAMEMILDAGKSLFWLLCVIGCTPSAADLFGEGSEIIKGFPLSSLKRIKGKSMPENKDDGESDEEDDDEDDDEGGEQDDGEEDYSGDEGNEQNDEEDDEEVNGGGDGDGSEDDDEDDDDDEEDEDEDEDAEDEDDDEDEEVEEDQPPSKKQR